MFRWLLPFLLLAPVAMATPLEFRNGDRVVLVGNAFIERSQSYNHLETWLTTRLADRTLTFRNLGWSGDTVFGEARSYFGPPQEGFDRLKKHLEDLKPTIILSCYGAVAAFDGEAGIPPFLEGYKTLLTMFEATGARIAILSPPPAENLPAPLPNQDAHNQRLRLYSDALRTLADERSYPLIDVFGHLLQQWPSLPHPLTENGIHYTDAGYAAITPSLAELLHVPTEPFSIDLDSTSGKASSSHATVESVSTNNKTTTLQIRPHSATPQSLSLRVQGLPAGAYTVMENNRQLATGTAEEFAKGISIPATRWNAQLAPLRQAIHKKNELFFHRWRPQNETYLFGFRKHEQGNNAVEIPQFEQWINEQEALIERLKLPALLPLTITPKR